MTKWNPETKRSELEPYEVDAYWVGRSLDEPPRQTRVVRREVHLDEQGRPRLLVEEFIDIDE